MLVSVLITLRHFFWRDFCRALWNAAFPEEKLHGLISDQWKEMGWQGKDPSTDFRGGGFISLENFLFFSRNFPELKRSRN
ncbi:uncharacterized protein LOC130740579 isoform X2 [Lotus japonicus]|uniref:uncharacterized protein LOC130740579 isoform X2 n=1 Tax=Lotus japonicus TaxID=34305 RepID=UPI00258EE3E5|nr:uncharacterized protein LOC130740579 isoform X2 [Lotus japonicus]